MGSPDQQQHDQDKLSRFAAELLQRHIDSRLASGAWGEVTLVLVFERGRLKTITAIDKTNIRADLLGHYNTGRQEATRQSK